MLGLLAAVHDLLPDALAILFGVGLLVVVAVIVLYWLFTRLDWH